nr:4-hydroxy-tetrahydrodipicolinate synthase [Candidatus Njordarchaeum guaymaensis]
MKWELRGTFTALITPFKQDGEIDKEGLRQLIELQLEGGVNGVVPCGTTGESATLSHDEKHVVVKTVVDASNGKVPVLAGAGTNNTADTLRLAKEFADVGVDGLLLVAPYYNRPTQEGMFQHFKVVAQSVSLPVVLYNIPGRTASNLEVSTVQRLCEIMNIVGLKESSGNFSQIMRLMEMVGAKISIVSGDDPLTLPIMALGGRGVISVASNLVPEEMSRLVNEALSGNFREARQLHYRLLPLFDALFVETNPAPLKMAMSMLRLPAGTVRLPLVPVSEESTHKIKRVLDQLGLSEKTVA